jgi:ParB-like chromosome segregation protein Spo0J
MNSVKRKLTDLRVYENNPRDNNEAIKFVKESIIKYGYLVPIVIDQHNVIIAGHTRFSALIEINEERGGYDEFNCILASDLTEEQVKEFRIVDNQVAQIATWNMTSLKFELDSLPNFNIEDFGGLPELTIEEIQIQEEAKIDLGSDKILIKIAGDTIEMTEMEYNQWVQYVIGTHNKSIVEFVREQLHLRPQDRTYEIVEI